MKNMFRISVVSVLLLLSIGVFAQRSTTDPSDSEQPTSVVPLLEELVVIREQQAAAAMAQQRLRVSNVGFKAEIDLIEARLRLAEAKDNSEEAIQLLTSLVDLHRNQVEILRLRAQRSSPVSIALVREARVELLEAQIRLVERGAADEE